MQRPFSKDIYDRIKPTWKEYLTPYIGYKRYTCRAEEVIRQYYDRMSITDRNEFVGLGIKGLTKLAFAHTIETFAIVGGLCYSLSLIFSR